MIPSDPSTAQPSCSTSPKGRTLRLSLGQKIGEGGCGFVYEATDVSLSGFSQDILPPLVVKICRNFQHYKLPFEAAIYEEMRPLHGVITARYYGCFETLVRPGIAFPIWNISKGLFKPGVTETDHPHMSRVLTMIVMEKLGSKHLPRGKRATEPSLR